MTWAPSSSHDTLLIILLFTIAYWNLFLGQDIYAYSLPPHEHPVTLLTATELGFKLKANLALLEPFALHRDEALAKD